MGMQLTPIATRFFYLQVIPAQAGAENHRRWIHSFWLISKMDTW